MLAVSSLTEVIQMDLIFQKLGDVLKTHPVFQLWLRGFLGNVRKKILSTSLLLIHGLSVGSTYRRNSLELSEDTDVPVESNQLM